MSWIRSVAYSESRGRLRKIYDRIKGTDDYLDNIVTVHGQRPHTLEGHMALYKSVLHHSGNTLPRWFLEVIGIQVSLLNDCDYCVAHHCRGLENNMTDPVRARSLIDAVRSGRDGVFDARETAMLGYVRRLTERPASVDKEHVAQLASAGVGDAEILEINQVAAYFAYANRTVLGLGVTTDGDRLGLSPADTGDPDSWRHDVPDPTA